jgi:aldose sugar dehydrogenase
MSGSIDVAHRRRPAAAATPAWRRHAARHTVACTAIFVMVACGQDTATDRGPVERGTHQVRTVTVASGLDFPWGMAFLPDGGILVTERSGQLRLVRDGRLQETPLAGVPPVFAQGQGGLLDVALHPDFARNRLVYLSFSKPGPQGATTAVVRGRLEGDRLAEVVEVIETAAWGTARQHFGSRLAFDRAGDLYITIGDRGVMDRAQRTDDHAGTVLRLHDDGRVPADNPFVGRAGFLPEIFSYGHRNAQGMVLHPATGEIWLHEHGPRGGDEINLVRAGRNYGWPLVTHGVNYDGTTITTDTVLPGIEPPLLHWTPSIAPSGMAVYTGDRFPNWRGDVFAGALAGRHLRRVRFDGTRVVEQERLLDDVARIRDVRVGPDGYLYVLTDAPDGALLRLEPADSPGS